MGIKRVTTPKGQVRYEVRAWVGGVEQPVVDPSIMVTRPLGVLQLGWLQVTATSENPSWLKSWG